MNKRAQVLFFGFMLGLTAIVLALALAFPVKQAVEIASNVTNEDTIGMDCTNTTISNFQRAGCIVADLSIFYFIGGVLFLAGAAITARIVFG